VCGLTIANIKLVVNRFRSFFEQFSIRTLPDESNEGALTLCTAKNACEQEWRARSSSPAPVQSGVPSKPWVLAPKNGIGDLLQFTIIQ
jgi:hypothetical protein